MKELSTRKEENLSYFILVAPVLLSSAIFSSDVQLLHVELKLIFPCSMSGIVKNNDES